jgi:Na+/glutamate symporter
MRNDIALGFIAVVGMGILLGFLIGGRIADIRMKNNAIQAGVAEYRVDPKTGETSFHFITKETSK